MPLCELFEIVLVLIIIPKKPHPQKAARSSLTHSATTCAPSTPGFGAGAAFYAKTLWIERILEREKNGGFQNRSNTVHPFSMKDLCIGKMEKCFARLLT